MIVFLFESISKNPPEESAFSFLTLSKSEIVSSISFLSVFSNFFRFSKLAFSVLTSAIMSYFLSIFASTIFFFASISNSFSERFLVYSASSSSFSLSSLANFSLFLVKASFFSSLCFFSSSSSSFLLVNSSISPNSLS
jgi:hypothetical protein